MEENNSTKINLSTAICMFLIFLLIIALAVVYYLGFVKNKEDLDGLKIQKASLETEVSELENKISILQVNNDKNSEKVSISLPLGRFDGTEMDDDINLNESVYGGADDFSVILKKNNMCVVYHGYGSSSLGIYKIENNKLICNTIIERGEEGPLVYSESNTIYEYDIIDKNTIKLVNLSGENSDSDIYSRKIGRIFKFSN